MATPLINSLNIYNQIGPISQIVIQPTSFCNLRCRYCYLSLDERRSKNLMPVSMPADIIQFAIKSGYANKKMELRWHAGEPLSIGLKFFEEAITKIEKILEKKSYTLQHTIQTNATYINKKWCDFFKKYNFKVGVSIDGPESIHDLYRVTRSNNGTFKITMRGIEMLQKNNIDFDIIAVVTKPALEMPNEIYDFFKSLKPRVIGFNIEETEARNVSSSLDNQFMNNYQKFLSIIQKKAYRDNVTIRELDYISRAMKARSNHVFNVLTTPFVILSVDYQGNYSTFCPELLGQSNHTYGSFNLGNIYHHTIPEIVNSSNFKNIYNSINSGVKQCEQLCPYFSVCGGGAPCNKLYENGDFDSTQTHYCQAKIQLPAEILLDAFEAGNLDNKKAAVTL